MTDLCAKGLSHCHCQQEVACWAQNLVDDLSHLLEQICHILRHVSASVVHPPCITLVCQPSSAYFGCKLIGQSKKPSVPLPLDQLKALHVLPDLLRINILLLPTCVAQAMTISNDSTASLACLVATFQNLAKCCSRKIM